MTSRPEAILIAGPTASGKSALAMRLAMRLAARLASDSGGLVINADSMQVYRDLRILTARPSEADECAVPHALFGTVDGRSSHSVRLWLADAARALAAASEAGAVPIFVGGTGLYFKALTLGLSNIPQVPEAVRGEVRAWAQGRPPSEIHAALAACDPAAAARLRPTDPQRLVRALEVFKSTGRSLLTFQQQREPALLDATRCAAVYLAPDRADLRERLDQRFDRMMSEGALAEVARLAERRLDPALPIMRALGVPPLLRHLAGDLALDAAVAAAKADTRRYVKRQDTFARNQLPAFRPVVPEAAEAFLVAELQS